MKNQILKYFRLPETHPTADELFEKVKNETPDLSKQAFLDQLADLEKQERLKVVIDSDNQKHYHNRTDRHFHFICTVCGKVKDITLDDGAVAMIADHVNQKVKSFGRVSTINMSFEGPCHECE